VFIYAGITFRDWMLQTAGDSRGGPPVKTADVPAPAPLNLSNVATYTEQTYQIDVLVGQEFAIGMFELIPEFSPTIHMTQNTLNHWDILRFPMILLLLITMEPSGSFT
jgi:hypothetical protein